MAKGINISPRSETNRSATSSPANGKAGEGSRTKLLAKYEEFLTSDSKWRTKHELIGPYIFVTCNLVQPPVNAVPQPPVTSLLGTCVSSLHRLKDPNNHEGAFFVFGDLSPKVEGLFALQFNLYELGQHHAIQVQSTLSEKFQVQGPKLFVGLAESTSLTRSFSDQGVRLRVRKEPRSLLRKRGPASNEYAPRSYSKQRLRQEVVEEQKEEALDSPLSSRHSQVELQGATQPSLEGPHEQQAIPLVSSSHQSALSYCSYPDEGVSKRPRMGPEQSQFGHPSQPSPYYGQQMAAYGLPRPTLPVIPLEYPYREFCTIESDYQQSYASYPQQSSQQTYGGETYVRSPPAVQGGYFIPHYNIQQGITSPSYHPSAVNHLAAESGAPYHSVHGYSESAIHTSYGNIDDGSRALALGDPSLGSSQYGTRMAPIFDIVEHQGDRRGSYIVPQVFPSLNQSLPADLTMVSTQNSSIPITTAGLMDNTYP